MKKATVEKALLKDIKRFCKEKDLIFNQKRLTINNKKIYSENGRFFYLKGKVDVMKDYYINNGESTNYGVSSYVNRYKFSR